MSDDMFRLRYPDAREWTVYRHYHDLRHVRVMLDHSAVLAPPAWIARLRRLCPELQGRRPADLLREVRGTSAVDFGVMPGRNAYAMAQRLRAEDFVVHLEDASYVGHLASVAGSALIIEDEAECKAFCQRLIREGAQVVPVEG